MGYLAALAIILAGVFIFRLISKWLSASTVEDDPDQIYSIFTDEFDVVCPASDVRDVLEANAINWKASKYAFQSADSRAAAAKDRLKSRQENRKEWLSPDLGESAFLILLDQSGSMADKMPIIAADTASAMEQLEAAGGNVMLGGYTTVGWHGGRSRQSWRRSSKPYPGRLCDLLHIIHKPFETSAKDWQFDLLIEPQTLFENVDGEALLWGAEVLEAQNSQTRYMIVLSDGAPVDDSTLTENDSGLLRRHLEETVGKIQSNGNIRLGAVGLDHRVDSLYQFSQFCDEDTSLDDAILKVAELLCSKS